MLSLAFPKWGTKGKACSFFPRKADNRQAVTTFFFLYCEDGKKTEFLGNPDYCPDHRWWKKNKIDGKRFHVNIKSVVEMSEHWNKLPKELVESPFLKILKGHLNKVQDSLLYVAVVVQEGLNQMTMRGSFHLRPLGNWFCSLIYGDF